MRYALFFIFVLLFLSFSPRVYEVEEETLPDYSGARIFINHKDNVCRWQRDDVADISITVNYIEPSDDIDYYGIWQPSENLITLVIEEGRDINTVAHEVYHVVQTKMEEQSVADPHWGAYIQGGLTDCVWQLVQTDKTYGGTY